MFPLAQDVRFATRALVRSRFVTAVAVLALALGIGVTTAVFSIFNGVLLTPLPYPDPDELVAVYDTQPSCSTCPASYPKYMDWKRRNTVFAAIGGSAQVAYTLTGAGEPARLNGVAATASLADVFGIQPRAGRWFTDQEAQFGGPSVIVLSHDMWTRQFNADPGILGRRIVLDGKPWEVIGVMPDGFTHRRAQFYVPLQRKLDPATRGNHFMPTYARRKKGVTLERATAEMRTLGETLAREFGHNHGVDVRSYYEVIVGGVRTSLRVLLGAVILVLFIACANVANLLLASGLGRRREFAIRMALGARPRDVARQLTAESVLLALAGGVLGIAFAWWAVRLFVVLAGNLLPRSNTIAVDANVFVFAAAVSLAVGVVCGLWPLLRLHTRDLTSIVRENDTRTVSAGGSRLGSTLVVAEIALAFALLVGAGLLVKNLILLRNRDAGVRTDHIISFVVAPTGPRYAAPEQSTAFFRDLYSRLIQVDGVEHAGMTSHLPMVDFGWNGEFQIEGTLPWNANQAPLVEYRWICGDYLQTMGVPLIKGRRLDSRDGKDSRTVLINQAMADKFWPGQDPIGKRFGQGSDRSTWYEVVGVIGNIRSFGLTQNMPYEFYRTLDQSAMPSMAVVIHTRADDPMSMVPIARQIVRDLDPSLPLTQIQTMESAVASSVGQPRLMSALTALFGALAGLLAMIGVYGVMAYDVRRQRREFGIRLALGADARRVRNLVVARGILLAAIGVAIGGATAWALGNVVAALLNDVKPTDPSVFALTAAAILLVAIVASYLPARAASRVDPIVVLRDA
ncbi:MAG TPA: ABC transporter permease [Vicinamibacterales bacterium]|nr:ABC transporter permease [Vicinamibacterales bacterium]